MWLKTSPNILLLNYPDPAKFLRSEQQLFEPIQICLYGYCPQTFTSNGVSCSRWEGSCRGGAKLKGRSGVLENWLAWGSSLKFTPSVAESVPCTWAWVSLVNQIHLFMDKPSSLVPPLSSHKFFSELVCILMWNEVVCMRIRVLHPG